MNFIGSTHEPNNLTNTLRLIRTLNKLPNESGEALRASKEYEEVIRCLVNFDRLYFRA